MNNTNTEEENRQLEIANTILKQLGGKLKTMIGASNILALKSGVQFDFKMNRKMNRCQIELNSMDLYDIRLYRNIKVTGYEKNLETMEEKMEKSKVVVKESTNLYNHDMLKSFEEMTGLYLSL